LHLKSLALGVSLLFAILAGCSVNVAGREFRTMGKRRSGRLRPNENGVKGVYPPPFLDEDENKWVAKCTPVSV
jgi:hypothetical protein